MQNKTPKIFEIQYVGAGSEKQVAWAKQIYDRQLDEMQQMYTEAQARVAQKTMPTMWLSIWDSVLNDERLIEAFKKFADCAAKDIIEARGYSFFNPKLGRRITLDLAKFAAKIAKEEYNKTNHQEQ